jgi:phosphoribosyl-ATP pyrophosphohydrolase
MKTIPGFYASRGAERRGRRVECDKTRGAQSIRQSFVHLGEAQTTPLANCGDAPGLAAALPALSHGTDELERLFTALGQVGPAKNPRTFRLVESSIRKIAQKVIEEAGEVAIEAVRYHANGVVRESADLLYHLVVLWRRAGVEPTEIWEAMRARADAFGIAEKLPKTFGRKAGGANPNR